MKYEIGTVCTKCGHGLFVSFCKKCGDLEKHDDAIRQECFNAAVEVVGYNLPKSDIDELERAILSTEPARDNRDYPEDAQSENGNYYCVCVTCGTTFVGHKRRTQCKVCASKLAREEQ